MKNTFVNARRARPLLGTFVEIAVTDAARIDIDAAIDDAYGAVARAHRLMSFHDPNSDVSRLNREASANVVTVDDWTFQVLESAAELNRRSAGMFDIAVAPALQELGLLPDLEDSAPLISTEPPTAEAIELLDCHCVRFRHPELRIDLGGIAKGFAVDRAVDVLMRHGISGGVVNAGGDLAAFGPVSHRVHIRDPRDPRRSICQVEVRDEALASTGVRFDPLNFAAASGSAVVNPRSGKPVHLIAGATVRTKSCMVADALTKVVMIAGESATAVLDYYQASALFVSADGNLRVTPDWQKAFRLAA
jgi:thiamine biosynthesis lipoprotein